MKTGRIGWPAGPIFDGFSGPLGDSLNGRTTESGRKVWSVTDGGGFQLDGVGQAFRLAGSGPMGEGAVVHLDAGFSDADVSVETNEITSNGARMGLVFRYVDDNNYWSFFAFRGSGGTRYYFLRSYVAGATVYDSGALTAGAVSGAIDLEVICDGTSIDCFYNGSNVISVSSSTHLTATGFGLQADIGSGYDNFSVVPV